jgi:hypothetical protein
MGTNIWDMIFQSAVLLFDHLDIKGLKVIMEFQDRLGIIFLSIKIQLSIISLNFF